MNLGTLQARSNVAAGSTLGTELWRAIKAALCKLHVQRKPRALRIQETVTLGDRRFLAIVQFENQKLLVGVTPQNITLLKACSLNNEKPAEGFNRDEEYSA